MKSPAVIVAYITWAVCDEIISCMVIFLAYVTQQQLALVVLCSYCSGVHVCGGDVN